MNHQPSSSTTTDQQKTDTYDQIRRRYGDLPVEYRKALEAIYKSARSSMTLPEVKEKTESYLPKLDKTEDEWLSILLDLIKQGMLIMDKRLQGDPTFKVHPALATLFVHEDIPAT